jgi:hypothetical protein
MDIPRDIKARFHHAADSYSRGVHDVSNEQVRHLVRRLWHCPEIMPSATCMALELESGSTYAQGAQSLKRKLNGKS